MSTELIALDVGGTHARFVRAAIADDGTIMLGEPVTLKTGDYASLRTAWEEFERREDKPVPRAASIAIAAPITGDTIRMTNNSWIFSTSGLDEQLGLDAVTLINDFGAVAHAVARAPEDQFALITGPEGPLPAQGTVSVIGAGTGLGVAHFHRYPGGYHVISTEGGHIDFAPLDEIEDRMLLKLRKEHRRVSTERVNSGPGIVEIYYALAELERRPAEPLDDKAIWERGIDRSDALAAAAVDRFCATFGAVCGDYALAHGASAVVLAGSLGLRLRELLPVSAFGDRFRFKGRYERMMAGIPVKLITHPQPGLYGAVAAFAREHLT
ncbi:MAG TPA: ROK family protein [Sphingomonadaceae bacterium]